MAYEGIDKKIYESGIHFRPLQEYAMEEYKWPTENTEGITNAGAAAGIPYTNAFTNAGGGAGSYAPRDLLPGFDSAINARQNRLQNPNKFSEFLAKFGIGGQRSVDQMMRDSTAYNMNELGPSYVTDSADETSIGNYPVANPLGVRKNMFGVSGILSRILPSAYHDKFTMPEQIYTQSKMGYTGPTVFGENNSGLQKDIFGRNTISASGNYAEKQAKDIQKLDDLFASDTFTNKYGNLSLEEDEEGNWGFTGGTKEQIDRANRMHKLNLIRYNFDKKGLKELEDIKDQTGFTDIMERENRDTDYGITAGVPDKDYSAVDNLDRAREKARESSDATTPDDFGQSQGMVDGWED